MHESYERHEGLAVGSDRTFGLLFVFVFAVVAAWPLFDGGSLRLWAVAVAALLLAVSLLVPKLLHPANVAWMRLGQLLGVVGGWIGLTLLYYGAFLPTGLLMRLFGKDPMRRRFERDAASYWIETPAAEQQKRSMRNQF